MSHTSPPPTFQKKIIFSPNSDSTFRFPSGEGWKFFLLRHGSPPHPNSIFEAFFRCDRIRISPARQQQKLLTFFCHTTLCLFLRSRKKFFPLFLWCLSLRAASKVGFFPLIFFRVIFARPLSFSAKLEETGGRKGRPLYIFVPFSFSRS